MASASDSLTGIGGTIAKLLNTMRYIHTREQLPIGQGFFHVGMVAAGDDTYPFHYIYDCGSANTVPLRRAIRRLVDDREGDSIDCLFVSHLDLDHVNGLDHLLVLLKVDVAVLPYLSPTSRLILMAKAVAGGRIDGTYMDFLCNPTKWLVDRGIDEVIYVTNGSPPEGEPPTFPPPGVSPAGEPPSEEPPTERVKDKAALLRLDITALEEDDSKAGPSRKTLRSKSRIISCREPLRLAWDGLAGLPNWQFVTFVHPEGDREDTFRQAVQRTFRRSLVTRKFEIDHKVLIETLQRPDERSRLASCYEVIRKNHNLVSLSVYSGPIDASGNVVIESEPFDSIGQLGRVAWLGTGDSNLRGRERRQAFLWHYDSLLPMVMTMSLPHHGSRHNFHSEILRASKYFVASAGRRNRYRHPHGTVTAQVGCYRLWKTTEDEETTLFERYVLR